MLPSLQLLAAELLRIPVLQLGFCWLAPLLPAGARERLSSREQREGCVGGCERGSWKEGTVRVGEVPTCPCRERSRCPAPLSPVLVEIRLAQQLGRSLRVPGALAQVESVDLGVWRFERTFPKSVTGRDSNSCLLCFSYGTAYFRFP